MSFPLEWIVNEGETDERTYEIEYTYQGGTPDVHTLRNGDPGYPGDPPEAEIQSVHLCGKLIDRAFWKLCIDAEAVLEYIYDNPPQAEEPEYTGEEEL